MKKKSHEYRLIETQTIQNNEHFFSMKFSAFQILLEIICIQHSFSQQNK